MSNYKDSIDFKNIPQHIAVIMDGNGRWAQKRSLPRIEGHKVGAKVVEKLVDTSLDLNIKCISLYAFSSENWTRPKTEVMGLWSLLEDFFENKISMMIEKGIQINHSGRLNRLPGSTKKAIQTAIEKTKKNKKLILNFCLNYGGRQEIVDAANSFVEKNRGKKITEKKLDNYFYNRLPDVDLLIRTSGECRISNFLLWQAAYAEFVFIKTLWPDFKAAHLYKSIIEYQKRSRRFGGI
jgi:undecaprenyl diphosphate synthase